MTLCLSMSGGKKAVEEGPFNTLMGHCPEWSSARGAYHGMAKQRGKEQRRAEHSMHRVERGRAHTVADRVFAMGFS